MPTENRKKRLIFGHPLPQWTPPAIRLINGHRVCGGSGSGAAKLIVQLLTARFQLFP
ncbi:hypothetical protein BDI4_10037 [Burkholderia diffusa]|nr:hypothetical protein BDI4_10037 [Burkholderia diffusa]